MTPCTTFADVIADVLPALYGMPATVARDMAEEIVRKAAERGHAGTDYHLHGLDYLTRDERTERIRREYNGRNVAELCRKFGVHRSTVYRIVRRGEGS